MTTKLPDRTPSVTITEVHVPAGIGSTGLSQGIVVP